MIGLQLIRKRMVKSAKECMKQQASHTEIYGKMHAVFVEMDPASLVSGQKVDTMCFYKLVSLNILFQFITITIYFLDRLLWTKNWRT